MTHWWVGHPSCMAGGKRGDDHSQEPGPLLWMLLGLGGRKRAVLILLGSPSRRGFPCCNRDSCRIWSSIFFVPQQLLNALRVLDLSHNKIQDCEHYLTVSILDWPAEFPPVQRILLKFCNHWHHIPTTWGIIKEITDVVWLRASACSLKTVVLCVQSECHQGKEGSVPHLKDRELAPVVTWQSSMAVW